MTDQEIEKLKNICEKEGFELDFISKSTQGAIDIFRVSKKDEWKGVEFAECVSDVKVDRYGKEIAKGQIYRILDWFNREVIYIDQSELGWQSKHFKPSTESAYVEQLKDKAHELYGDIKDGDRFKGEGFENKYVSFIGHDLGRGFIYQKCSDTLHLNHLLIYKQGKWAKKTERVIVEPTHRSWDNNGNVSYDLSFSFKVTGTIVVDNNEIISKHLAQCLEDYLNKS